VGFAEVLGPKKGARFGPKTWLKPKSLYSVYPEYNFNMLRTLKPLKWFPPVVAGFLLIAWLAATPPGLLGKADAIAYAVCHRIESHSFLVAGRQFPLCARCTGMYLGALLGLAYSFRSRRAAGFPPRRVLAVLAIFGLFFAIDGVNSYAGLLTQSDLVYAPSNLFRLVSGTLFGSAAGVYLAAAFKQAIWIDADPSPAVGSLRHVALLVCLGLAFDAAILADNPLLSIPLGLLAAGGVLVLLSLAYTMLWTVLLKQENFARSWRSIWRGLSLGFSTALAQVILIDIIRLVVTGTWAGFSL
jgi:uncharacterized membrane protein